MTKIGTIGAVAAVLVALSGCGNGDGGDRSGGPSGAPAWEEREADGAVALVVELTERIDAGKYADACDLIDPMRRADTCEDSLSRVHAEQADDGPLTPDLAAPVREHPYGCAVKIGDGGLNLIGSAMVTWSEGEDAFRINKLGNLDEDEFVGRQVLEDFEEHEC